MISDNALNEMGVIKSKEGVFIPKDFCLVTLLNLYQNETTVLTDEEHNAISKFLFHLELDLSICDGTKRHTLSRELLKRTNTLVCSKFHPSHQAAHIRCNALSLLYQHSPAKGI